MRLTESNIRHEAKMAAGEATGRLIRQGLVNIAVDSSTLVEGLRASIEVEILCGFMRLGIIVPADVEPVDIDAELASAGETFLDAMED